jgi:hypothetical protein
MGKFINLPRFHGGSSALGGIIMPFFATIDDYWFNQDKDHPLLHPFYTQIEVAGGFIATLRVGFNPGELLDFIVGWTTIDLFGDDLGMRRLRKERAEATATER